MRRRSAVREEWAHALRSGRIVICVPVRYELLYSARSAGAFEEIERRLAALREVAITAAVQRAALNAMRELAPLGRHRVPLPDLLIAATAALARTATTSAHQLRKTELAGLH